MANGFFARMGKEAAEELAKGEKGWKQVDTNTLVLACFYLLTNHMAHTLARPLWFFSSAIAAAVVFYVVRSMLGF